jgi:hypothetical protein
MTLRVVMLSLVASTLWVAPVCAAPEACGTCHPEIRTEYADGVHARHFGCVDCHGGDPAVVGVAAHSREKGYIGKPDRLRIPALCGDCHSDPVRMKPFDLPTDQYAQYETSEHGIRLAQDDERVAVCTDCHGTHRILPSWEPTSPVFRGNVPATCGHCHSNTELMAGYDLPTDQEERYRQGVHGVAALVDGHPNAPTCATCHGAHGAAGGEGDIRTICGHCHSRDLSYFLEGPHGAAARAGEMSECAACHGYHDTSHPTLALFDACEGCHAGGERALSVGRKLKAIIGRTGESLHATVSELEQLRHTFPTIVRYRPRLQQAHAFYVQARTMQHALDVERVEDLARTARSTSDDVRGAIHSIGQRTRLRRLGLAAAWVFLLFAAGVAYLYKRQRQRERQTPPDASTGSA